MGQTKCRIVEGGTCDITQWYKQGVHDGVDVVKMFGVCGYITAHSDGTVVGIRTDCKGTEGSGSYGNYIKIKHDNSYTLYAHIAYRTITVKNGDKVKKGQRLGYMGNTGYSFGAHLHFEVRDENDVRIDPIKYLNADLPNKQPIHKYKIGDVVKIKGVYVSSTSDKELKPAKYKGTITRIVEARNPYLLDDGKIGWINDDCVVEEKEIFKINDIVVPIKLVDYKGTNLVQYDSEYIIKRIDGNNAMLYANRSGQYYIWAILPFENIKKVR